MKNRSSVNRWLGMASRRLWGLVAVLATALWTGGCPQPPQPAPPGDGPRLVLFVVVDQLRADYLERFAPLLSGGLHRLIEESVSFSETHHGHAYTVTGAGHASLTTGVHPKAHGIVGNRWRDRETGKRVYAVDDERHGRSPRNLLASTLGGWLKERDPASKVFAVGGKDRASILTGGREADGAYWFDFEGGFSSSSYYDREAPEWLRAFNEAEPIDPLFGTTWELTPEAAAADAELGVVELDWGDFPAMEKRVFGGRATSPDDDFYDGVYGSPFLDEATARLAQAAISGEGLGEDGSVDFLGVAFSAVDTVGHQFGPHSRELIDAVVRLDRALGELLDFVDREIGLEHVIVSLSADHGVMAVPEALRRLGEPGGRLGSAEILCFQGLHQELAQRFGERHWFHGGLYLDPEEVEEAGVDGTEVVHATRAYLAGCPHVKRVWARDELVDLLTASSPIQTAYGNSYHRERSPDLLVQWEENFLAVRDIGTTHGSPYSYDTHVPWLLRLPSGTPGRVEARVETVDVPVTVAALLGLPTPAVSGRDRSSLLPGN